jgi:hypothetical protein
VTPNVSLEEEIVTKAYPHESRERYFYHSIPMGANADQERESVEIELFGSGDDLEYMSNVISSESVETINLKMDQEGRFISGVRRVSNRQHQKVSHERIEKDKNRVYIERGSGRTRKLKEIDLPTDKILAVDGSLLILLRSFPFNTNRKWNVWMVDFSGHSVTVTVHQSKIESVVVPAGEFECYRMEVVVRLPILRPTLTYWLATGKPHFLVKNIGKRGPFTSTYTPPGVEGRDLLIQPH